MIDRRIASVAAQVACALLLAAPLAAGAGGPLAVGRASTQTPADQDWRVAALPAESVGVTGGVDGQIPTAVTVAWLVSPQAQVDAVLVLRGPEGSFRSALIWGASCEGIEPSPRRFVRNRWRNLWQEAHDDCLVVAGPADLGSSLDAGQPEVAALLESRGALLAGAGYVVRARAARNGTFLEAVLFVRSTFRGSARPLSVDPGAAKIPPAIVQWGVELSAAVMASTLSWSGKFELPRIDIDPMPPARSERTARRNQPERGLYP